MTKQKIIEKLKKEIKDNKQEIKEIQQLNEKENEIHTTPTDDSIEWNNIDIKRYIKMINSIKEPKQIDTRDICEVAHTITAELCKAKKIPLNCKNARQCGDSSQDHSPKGIKEMTHYNKKSQAIFDRYFDLLDNNFRN